VERTWDGLPIAKDKPYGVSVVVWRQAGSDPEWLVLHRAHEGPEYAGDWAWGPPAGARLPGEDPQACAERELREETGLELECRLTTCGNDEWSVYEAEAPADAEVVLSPEHDAHRWLPADTAAALCLPQQVADSILAVSAGLS
jgi:8-oxo-dGTP pyrophosphatase MutT (NUDIX family)